MFFMFHTRIRTHTLHKGMHGMHGYYGIHTTEVSTSPQFL
jgi:hypothetical protein